MKDNKKKRIQIAIIVVCLSATIVVITYTYYLERSTCEPPEPPDVRLLCPNCQASWQMPWRSYAKYLANHQDPNSLLPPKVVCPHCREDGVYRAEKCGKCGLIFERGDGVNDFRDRCPDCGYSHTEQIRIEARKAQEEE